MKLLRDLLWKVPIIRSIAAEAVEEAASEYDYFHRGQGGMAGDVGHGAMCAVLYMRDKAGAIRRRGLQPPPPVPVGQDHWISAKPPFYI